MRRLFVWYVPVVAGLAAAALFAAGFYSFLAGRTGEPVNVAAETAATKQETPRGLVTPILLGDSLARGVGDRTGLGIGGRLDEELRRRGVRARRTVNISVSGARTGDLLRQIERPNVRSLLAGSNVIIVSIGGNDLWGGSDWRTSRMPDPDAAMDPVLERIEKAVTVAREASPDARIYLVGLYNPFSATPEGGALTPLVHRWNARLTQRFAGDPKVIVVQTLDLFAYRDRLSLDRFHPGDEGYALIARRIADSI